MNKLFVNKTHLKIIILVLLLLLGHLFYRNGKIKEYADERIFMDLEDSIETLGKMNDDIGKIILDDVVIQRDYHINNESIFALDILDDEIRDAYGLDLYSKWLRFVGSADYKIDCIVEDGRLNEKEKSYLKALHMYNKEVIDAYDKILGKYGLNELTILNGKHKGKNTIKIYEEFCKSTNKISRDEKYKILREYRPYEEKKIVENISMEEAKEIGNKIFKKLFPEDEVVYREDTRKNESEYTFINQSSKKDDHNSYRIEVNKTDGDIRIWKNVQYHTNAVSEKVMDQKGKEIAALFIDDTYNCYKKEKHYDIDNVHLIDRIDYNFIKKVDNIYDEMEEVKISINRFGAVDQLYLANPTGKVKEIIKPKLKKEEILSKIKNGVIKECILVRMRDGQLVYEVFVDLDHILYTYTFDANTGAHKAFGKSEIMYFNKEKDL
ncbi:hypothetical protein [Crassaminicella profunda]|uniref:hypothetical protein n=1 Tax=Crassaminicella profunda TaxID=1286698 RepID=UPI001CA6B904|nr:hypothetical protein [Crassaminicella profunda]QZY53917.1 hypothetical protein K7H06_12735 [Crassaminicella profunda]